MSDLSSSGLETPDDLTVFSRVCDDVLGYLGRKLPAVNWTVSRLDDTAQTWIDVRGQDFIRAGFALEAERTLCHRMIAGAPQVVDDAAVHGDYHDVAEPVGIHGYASVPIQLNPREPLGALCGLSTQPLDVDEVDHDLLHLLAGMLSHAFDLTQRSRSLDLQLRIARDDAMTDALTGVLNRRGWDEVAEEAARRTHMLGDRFLFLVVDLDGLKALNDSEGHAAGDDLIRTAATTLQTHLRKGDSVARIGGDEYAVVVQSAFVRTDGVAVADRLCRALQAEGVSASVGHAVLERDEAPSVALARADRSMYSAKLARRVDRSSA